MNLRKNIIPHHIISIFGVYKILEDDVDINLAFKKTQYTSNDLKRLSKDDVSFYQEEVFQKELYALQIRKRVSRLR